MRSTAETPSKQTADSNQVLCLLGKMSKYVFTFLRLFLLLLGFSIICLGVLCVSTCSFTCICGNNGVVFYCLLSVGLFLLVTGTFWSTFHEVLKYRGLSSILVRNPSHRELHISTVDRPDFYPPCYEDCTDPEKQTFPLPIASMLKQQEVINIPPPPYSGEFISDTDEQEQPPPYEFSVQQLWQQQTDNQESNTRGESDSHPSMQENSYQQDTGCQATSERAMHVRTSETGSE